MPHSILGVEVGNPYLRLWQVNYTPLFKQQVNNHELGFPEKGLNLF